jgi:hypothetical protein
VDDFYDTFLDKTKTYTFYLEFKRKRNGGNLFFVFHVKVYDVGWRAFYGLCMQWQYYMLHCSLMCRKIDAHCADRVNAEISSKKNKLRKTYLRKKAMKEGL